jgi:hypothetical protein
MKSTDLKMFVAAVGIIALQSCSTGSRNPAQAADSSPADITNCNLSECWQLRNSLDQRIEGLKSGHSVSITDMAVDLKGHALYMSQPQADAYCKSKNMRLPTAREYALYAQSNGSKGILDGSPAAGDYDSSMIDAIGSDSKEDKFYFNPKGFPTPMMPLRGTLAWFWTSDRPVDQSQFGNGQGSVGPDHFSYGFEANSGMIGRLGTVAEYGVRCFVPAGH